MLKLDVWRLGRKTNKVLFPSHHSKSTYYQHVIPGDVNTGHLTEVASDSFLHCKGIFSPFPSPLFERKSQGTAQASRVRNYAPPLGWRVGGWEYLHQYFDSSVMSILTFTDLLNHLYQHGVIDIYFMLPSKTMPYIVLLDLLFLL